VAVQPEWRLEASSQPSQRARPAVHAVRPVIDPPRRDMADEQDGLSGWPPPQAQPRHQHTADPGEAADLQALGAAVSWYPGEADHGDLAIGPGLTVGKRLWEVHRGGIAGLPVTPDVVVPPDVGEGHCLEDIGHEAEVIDRKIAASHDQVDLSQAGACLRRFEAPIDLVRQRQDLVRPAQPLLEQPRVGPGDLEASRHGCASPEFVSASSAAASASCRAASRTAPAASASSALRASSTREGPPRCTSLRAERRPSPA
jgi:hypothetical protein